MTGYLTDSVKNGHSCNSDHATLSRVAQHSMSIVQILMKSVAELNPIAAFNVAPIKIKHTRQRRYVLSKIDRAGNVCSEHGPNVRKFAQIHFDSACRGQCSHERICGLSEFKVILQRNTTIGRSCRWRCKRVRNPKIPNCSLRRLKLSDVSGCKDRTYSAASKEPLDCRYRERSDNTRYSTDTGPSIPVHYTCLAEPPALTYPVEKAHLMNPPDFWPEFCHGSVAK